VENQCINFSVDFGGGKIYNRWDEENVSTKEETPGPSPRFQEADEYTNRTPSASSQAE